jgi:hypothetical protein
MLWWIAVVLARSASVRMMFWVAEYLSGGQPGDAGRNLLQAWCFANWRAKVHVGWVVRENEQMQLT